MPTCRLCKNKFERERPLQPVCNNCSYEYAVKLTEKYAKKRKVEERKNDKEKKIKLKRRTDWVREAQTAWNSYVRTRDSGKGCISCTDQLRENKRGGMADCSHYRSRGSAPHLRFHLHNAATACIKCNRWLGGNVAEMRKGLIVRIGIEKVEALEANNAPRKFDIEYLKRIKDIFSRKTRRLKQRQQ